jgi:hypothetical protein
MEEWLTLLLALELSKGSSLEPSWGMSVKETGEELLRPCTVDGFLFGCRIGSWGVSSHYFLEDQLSKSF